jgi:hypothetical protein
MVRAHLSVRLSTRGCLLALLVGCGGSKGATIKGLVVDPGGIPVAGAEVAVGKAKIATQWNGGFTLSDLPLGSSQVEVTAPWFQTLSEEVSLQAGQLLERNFQLQAMPLELLPQDRELAEKYDSTFDWAVQSTSIRVVAVPTRRNIDRAVYHRNPALLIGTQDLARVTPAQPISLAHRDPLGFPTPSGQCKSAGQDVLDTSSIRNTATEAGLTDVTLNGGLMWEPAIKGHLMHDYAIDDVGLGLHCVGLAIQSQKWGTTFESKYPPPQLPEELYLHQGELWVKVRFARWLNVESDITDSDEDKHPEIYAKIKPSSYTAETIRRLFEEKAYVQDRLDTLELRAYMQDVLLDFYGKTNPEYHSVIGAPYSVNGLGTLEYPFAVLEHEKGVVNVFLVGPGE